MRPTVLLVLLLGFAAGCGGSAAVPTVTTTASARAAADGEALVKAYLKENVNDFNSVEFVKWGPHLDYVKKSDGAPLLLVRLKFRQSNGTGGKELVDKIFVVKDGKVKLALLNGYGDNWTGFTSAFAIIETL